LLPLYHTRSLYHTHSLTHSPVYQFHTRCILGFTSRFRGIVGLFTAYPPTRLSARGDGTRRDETSYASARLYIRSTCSSLSVFHFISFAFVSICLTLYHFLHMLIFYVGMRRGLFASSINTSRRGGDNMQAPLPRLRSTFYCLRNRRCALLWLCLLACTHVPYSFLGRPFATTSATFLDFWMKKARSRALRPSSIRLWYC
jgi:hypothetical protein